MSTIRTTVNYEGVQQGAAQIDALIDRLGDLMTAEERATVRSQRFERAIEEQADAARSARVALGGHAEGMVGVGRSSRQSSMRMAEMINITSEMSLGLGALSPKLREVSVQLAMAGNNAVQFASMGLGPVGVAAGALVGLIPTVIGLLSDMGDEADGTATEMRDLARDTESAAGQMDALVRAIQRRNAETARASRLEMGMGTPEEREARAIQLEKNINDLEADLRALAGRERSAIRRGGGLTRSQRSQFDEDRARLERELRQAREEEDRFSFQSSVSTFEEGEDVREQLREGAEEDGRRGRRGGGAAAARAAREREREAEAERQQRVRAKEAENQTILNQEREARAEAERAMEREIDLKRRIHEEQAEADARAIEAANMRGRLLEKERQEAAELTEQRAQEMRSITAEVEGPIREITALFNEAFQAAIEGEQSFEEALAQGSKQLLMTFGEELVAKGIGSILEGITMTVTNPPGAATKIGGGAAMVAFGVGLGAAGAAIPSPSAPAAAERPRQDSPDRQESGGPQMLVMNVNNPVMSAETHAQLARGLKRTLRADRSFAAGGGDS